MAPLDAAGVPLPASVASGPSRRTGAPSKGSQKAPSGDGVSHSVLLIPACSVDVEHAASVSEVRCTSYVSLSYSERSWRIA